MQLRYQLVQANRGHDLIQALLADLAGPVDHVLTQGALKEPGILQHHGKEGINLLTGQIGGGHPVNANLPRIELVEAHKQVDQGSLTGPGRAHNRHLLSGSHRGGKAVDNLLARLVAEADVLKVHSTAHGLGQGSALGGLVRQFLGLQELKDASARSRRRLQGGSGLG